ncbi:MAG: hypothetical protein GEU73_12885 [Chloroflexi bacterium]|nr:hypothetical protein [Chloroflexota bacterium]
MEACPLTELARLPIHDLAPLIARREVSPVEVTRDALARIEALDGRLRTFIAVWPDQALADARTAEAEIAGGGTRGPLHGVPIGIKDNIAVAGWPTTNGSSLMTDHVTDYDATVVSRLRAAGAVIVGKNNMHEWAMGGTSAKSAFGAVHNPWDERRSPGGSSGGSAAAVSASLVYGSVGTDNKGSVRLPAAFCGVVGLKPTYGLVSRFGELPPTSATTDHLGPIAKDVRDAALLLNAMAGYDQADPCSIRSATRNFAEGIDGGVAGVRVGVPSDYFFEQAAEQVEVLVRAAVSTLESLGAEVREVRLPSVRHTPLVDVASTAESRAFLLPFARLGPEAFADRSIWDRLVVGEFLRMSDFLKASRLRNLIRREFLTAMEQVDVLAMPTAASPATPLEAPPTLPNGDRNPLTMTTTLTAPFNYVGMPAVSVPCGLSPDGLPIGLMLAGPHWRDDLVLRVAYAYEQAATGGYMAPPIAGREA